MNEIEFSALMVSRVCHDLVGPLGAVVNGLEVLEDERDAAMREDAIRLVATSANQALARIQFMRIAFGAAGSAGAELDLGEVGRLIQGLLEGGKVKLEWNVPQSYWAKDWAKLLMNATLLGADCLPRGGAVRVEAGAGTPRFRIHASGQVARMAEEVERALKDGESLGPLDARAIQPYLTHRLSRSVHGALNVTVGAGFVEITAG
ncbi:MAG TPA: histidine phosphotransferase family protein [Rhizomicrobium sp.]|nr:histidine phosphotransferase family protein [Rhizomicrobium sp.]